jgi:hypothetical protein
MKNCLVIIMLALVSACASKTMQTAAVASQETLADGNALIVVERKQELNAKANPAELLDNGEVIGVLGVDGAKLIWQRPAGRMSLKITPRTAVRDLPPVTKEVAAGQTYNFIVEWSYGSYSLVIEER